MENIIVALVLWVLGGLIIWKLILPDWNKKKRVRAILWGFVAFTFIIDGFVGITGNYENTNSSSENTSSSSKISSKQSQSSNKASSKSSSKKGSESKANKALEKWLEQDQEWAYGKFDSDGNSTDSGEPQSQFNWSTHIQKMTYSKNDHLSIYFFDSQSLSKTEKDEIVSSARNSAIAALMDAGVIDDDEASDGLSVTVYQGNKIIGTSKILNKNEISWD